MKTLCVSLALALFAVAPLFAQSPPHNDRQIIPGKRAGLISLEEQLSQVEQSLGAPRARETKMDRQWLVWPADKNGGTIAVYCKEIDDKGFGVVHIRVTSEKYFTPGGIYVGTGISRINAIYPDAKSAPVGASGRTLIDAVSDGVAFEVSPGSNGSPALCTVILVHKPGKPIFASVDTSVNTW